MSTARKNLLRYEDSASRVTVTGWACDVCGRFYAGNEHLARFCCSKDRPCDCGNRITNVYAYCEDCLAKKALDRWNQKKVVDWDGDHPIALFDGDTFFFHLEDLDEYLTELAAGNDASFDRDRDGIKAFRELLESNKVRLVMCNPDHGQHFEMSDFLCDSLPEDGDLDSSEIDKTVNDWIKANAPFSWWATGDRLSVDSVIDCLS